MAYLQELRRKMAEIGGVPAPEVQLLGRTKCVVAGHKGLYSVSDEEVIVRRRDGRLIVRGTGLRVEYADEGEIRIGGEVVSVTMVGE